MNGELEDRIRHGLHIAGFILRSSSDWDRKVRILKKTLGIMKDHRSNLLMLLG